MKMLQQFCKSVEILAAFVATECKQKLIKYNICIFVGQSKMNIADKEY